MALITTTNKQEFETHVLKNDKYVLVDFWAVWCPPCRMMEPILKTLAEDMDTTPDVVKVNVEESHDNGMLSQEYGVRGIPNMQLFKDGKVVKEFVGARPMAAFRAELAAITH